jgi:hypothetical protein
MLNNKKFRAMIIYKKDTLERAEESDLHIGISKITIIYFLGIPIYKSEKKLPVSSLYHYK